MNKEELKNEIRMLRDSMYREYKDTSRGPDASRWAHVRYNLWVEALKMVDQLEEPAKVLVPQFVADHIEFCKSKNKRLNVALSESHESKMVFEMGVNWEEVNEIYARAWLDGYKIEKEKLYYVIDKSRRPILTIHEGKVTSSVSALKVERAEKLLSPDFKYRLTEKQIKDYDPRFMALAVEVAE